ncbi:MAG: ACT domain-containing protein, partial [Desulfurococcales archaeon]|nr:ACT domain-containing protein [Desulfurococcales archaeon]
LRPLINALPELEGKTRMFLLLQSLNTFTLIIDEDYLDKISELIGGDIVEEYRGQSALVIVSPKELVETPGFIAYITGLLSGEGINITQIESSYTDTILVMKKQDAMRALEILLKAIDAARSQLGLK